jgi:hypothetical protein
MAPRRRSFVARLPSLPHGRGALDVEPIVSARPSRSSRFARHHLSSVLPGKRPRFFLRAKVEHALVVERRVHRVDRMLPRLTGLDRPRPARMDDPPPRGQERPRGLHMCSTPIVWAVIAHLVDALPVQHDDHAATPPHILTDGAGKREGRPVFRERAVEPAWVVHGGAERDEALNVGAPVDVGVRVPDEACRRAQSETSARRTAPARPLTSARGASSSETDRGPASVRRSRDPAPPSSACGSSVHLPRPDDPISHDGCDRSDQTRHLASGNGPAHSGLAARVHGLGPLSNPIRRRVGTGGVVILLQFVELSSQVGMRRKQTSQANKRPHDLDVDLHRARTAQDA